MLVSHPNNCNKKTSQKLLLKLAFERFTGSPSVLCCIDLEMPEEDSKWAFVSDYKIGLLPHHDSLLMSKESQIRAHKEELNQRSSNLTLTYFFMHLEKARCLLPLLIKLVPHHIFLNMFYHLTKM